MYNELLPIYEDKDIGCYCFRIDYVIGGAAKGSGDNLFFGEF